MTTRKQLSIRTIARDITPKLAEQFLKMNTLNRPVQPVMVTRMARDMMSGRFQFTHQGIAFSRPGETLNGKHYERPVLVDGQHRLLAIRESGVTMRMLVTYNLPLTSQTVIDDHGKRKTAQQYGLERGVSISNLHAAVAKMMHRRGLPALRAAMTLTRSEEMDAIDTYWEGMQFVMSHAGHTKRFITVAPVLAEIGRASYTEDKEKLSAFIEGLLTGANLGRRSPVLVLRNTLLAQGQGQRAAAGSVMSRDDVADRTAVALRAFLDNKELHHLKPRAASSVPRFPVPGDRHDVTKGTKARRKKARS